MMIMSETIHLPKTAIPLPMDEIVAFCKRWNIIRMELFGSILRDDFDPEQSDIDFLVTYAPEAAPKTYRVLFAIEDDIAALTGCKVDLVDRRSIEQSENYIRRRAILETAQVIYE